jgi:zinc protease
MCQSRGGGYPAGRGRRPAFSGWPLAPILILTCLSLTAFSAVARTPAPPVTAPPAAATKPARLDYKEARLKNGLKVVTLEDHRAPVATLQIWYHVGSKDEPKGQQGFAHLFEHLMFKGSKNVGPEQHARYVEQVGASYNANTSFDRTLYFETVPSNALERMLFLEADRMASLKVDEANLKSERDVVKEEYRLRVANAPYGSLLPDVLKETYPAGHPYAHSTIGSIPDLDAATLPAVRAFHEEYYKPDNATLVLVGDFNTGDALKMIEKYFGPISKSKDGKFTRRPVPADTQKAERRETHYDKLAPLPLVGMAFRLPEPGSPDTPVFDVISQILSAGQSSRLYRSLVRDSQLAVDAGGGSLDLRLGGLYFVTATANAGKDPKAVENALQAEVDRLRTAPVGDGELTKARNQVLSGLVFGRISTEAKASALGNADLLYGTPEEANRTFDKLTRVTAADVQRVAQTYFAPDRRNVFSILPASMQKGTK